MMNWVLSGVIFLCACLYLCIGVLLAIMGHKNIQASDQQFNTHDVDRLDTYMIYLWPYALLTSFLLNIVEKATE